MCACIDVLRCLLAKDLAVVGVADIMMTEREVGIKNEVPAIETAAERGDDKYNKYLTIHYHIV